MHFYFIVTRGCTEIEWCVHIFQNAFPHSFLFVNCYLIYKLIKGCLPLKLRLRTQFLKLRIGQLTSKNLGCTANVALPLGKESKTAEILEKYFVLYVDVWGVTYKEEFIPKSKEWSEKSGGKCWNYTIQDNCNLCGYPKSRRKGRRESYCFIEGAPQAGV